MSSGGGAPMRDLYGETAGELAAKADLAPKVYATESQFRPQYNALDLQSINTLLEGTPGQSRQIDYQEQVTKYRNPETGEISDTPRTTSPGPSVSNGSNGRSSAGPSVAWQPIQVPVSRSRTVQDPATPGYLDIADRVAGRVAAIDAKGLSTQREADIGDVSKLGGLSLAAQQAADPRTAALIESLTTDATDELARGSSLDPAQTRLAQQSVRSRYQGTLSGIGPSGDFKEAMGLTEYAQKLRDQRRAYATGVVGLRSGVYGDAFNRVLGRPASASPQGTLGTAYGISQGAGPKMFGSTINANDVASSNQNAAAANSAAKAAQTNTYAGAGIGAGAGILAALI